MLQLMSGNDYKDSEWKQQQRRGMRRESEEDPRYGGSVITGHQEIRNLPHFCRQDAMHLCIACESSDRQKNCHFHIPSTGGNHCMELRFDEYCANHILHQYVAGGISNAKAKSLITNEKKRLAEIQNKAEGYHIIFPLHGEETLDDLQDIYQQLCDLGLTMPEFWVDRNGKPASEYISFAVTLDNIKNGDWSPKRKELIKDILKYFDLREKLGY